MMLIINLLEAFISVYTIAELTLIKNKKLFIFISVLFTMITSSVCDYYQLNSWHLLVLYSIIWFLLSSCFTKNNYLYNLFISILCNYIINLSLFIPLLFIYHKSVLLASIVGRIIQFIISYAFILYRRRFRYIHNKYWTPILLILICCMIIMENEFYNCISFEITVISIMIIILTFVISIISLLFFHIIEAFIKENNSINEKLEQSKYKSVSDSLIISTKNELIRLQHSMLYKLLLIKNNIMSNNLKETIKIIDEHMLSISKKSQIITTGNEIFDVTLSLKSKDLTFNIIRCFNISVRDFYNSINFINFIIELLSIIKDCNTVYFYLEEVSNYCIIKLSSNQPFYDYNELISIIDKNSAIINHHSISNNNDLYFIKVAMNFNDENTM